MDSIRHTDTRYEQDTSASHATFRAIDSLKDNKDSMEDRAQINGKQPKILGRIPFLFLSHRTTSFDVFFEGVGRARVGDVIRVGLI